MAVGTKALAPTELDTFDESRLNEELRRAKEELFNLRFQSATGQLEGHGRLRAVKKDIARIYTVLRERELGIRAIPAPVETPAAAPKRSRSRKAESADTKPSKAESATAEDAAAPTTPDSTEETS
jgi:large subunit ribosomal protein L29